MVPSIPRMLHLTGILYLLYAEQLSIWTTRPRNLNLNNCYSKSRCDVTSGLKLCSSSRSTVTEKIVSAWQHYRVLISARKSVGFALATYSDRKRTDMAFWLRAASVVPFFQLRKDPTRVPTAECNERESLLVSRECSKLMIDSRRAAARHTLWLTCLEEPKNPCRYCAYPSTARDSQTVLWANIPWTRWTRSSGHSEPILTLGDLSLHRHFSNPPCRPSLTLVCIHSPFSSRLRAFRICQCQKLCSCWLTLLCINVMERSTLERRREKYKADAFATRWSSG